jgi:radical SAM protein with 4Fe4S-binding SPASM domain
MGDEEYLTIIDQLLEAKVFKYILTGGEPLMRRDLVFAILDKIGPCGSVQLNTNATMITDRVAKRLADFRGPLRVVTSIDSPIEEINALTRGKGYLGKTLRGVDNLIKCGIVPRVNCVLTLNNRHHVPQLVELLRSHGVNSLGILHFQPMGYGIDNEEKLALTVPLRETFNKDIRALKESCSRFNIFDQDDQDWFGHEERYRRSVSCGGPKAGSRNLLPCSAGIDQCNILADGTVTPCNYMFDYSCGNVREETFRDIWRNSPALKLVRALRSIPVTRIEECVGCEYNMFCQGGCRAMGYASTRSLTGLDPSCPYFKRRSTGLRRLPLLNHSLRGPGISGTLEAYGLQSKRR